MSARTGGARVQRGARPRARAAWARRARPAVARGEAAALAACLAAAALTLLAPWTPTFDPWSWIVWGRQILHLHLSTATGPSWKPLPMVFTVPFAALGAAAPALWLIVARAAALAALVCAFRLARRLVPGPAGILAGALAAFGLLFSVGYIVTNALGNSEGMLIVCLLAAVDRHLDGRHRQALVLGVLAGLLRPEVWPFLVAYAAWLWWSGRVSARLAIALGVLTLALWTLPEKWGSGSFTRAADRAATPLKTALAYAAHPFQAVVDAARDALMVPYRAGVIAAAVLGAVALARRRPRGAAPLVIGLGAVAWVGLVAVMTTAGFAGNPRYLMSATAVFCVVAGVAGGQLVALVGAAARRRGRRAAALAGSLAAAALVAWVVVAATERFDRLPDAFRELRYQAELRETLPAALALAGGRDRIVSCGQPSTELYQVPMLSWHLRVPMAVIHFKRLPPRGYLLQTSATRTYGLAPRLRRGDRRLGVAGPWRVYAAGCLG